MTRTRHKLSWVSFSVLLLLIHSPAIASENALQIYDKTTDIVTHNFYDQTFQNLPWSDLVQRYRSELKSSSSDEKLSQTLNKLLDELHASHTEFLNSSDQEYWALKSIFSGDIKGEPIQQVGAWFIKLQNKWFVKNVFSGTPAEKSGLLAGDEIISADKQSFHPVDSFLAKKTVILKVRRTQNGPTITLKLNPVLESFQQTLLRATKKSFVTITRGKTRAAYFHLWSGTHDDFKSELKDAATHARDKSDVLILDLRDGFGGAYPEFIEPFFSQGSKEAIYSKPLIVLINDGVRSGKEWITYILKQEKRATLIGTQTKGYFLAGKPFEIQPGRFLLYLAVSEVPSAPKLEHNGVKPDIEVQFQLPYSQGADPVLEKAFQYIDNLHP